MKWFKFYGQDWLSDPKTLALSAMERSCWITLLSYGSINDNGMITFLDEEQLMAQSGISPMREEWEATKGVLKKFEKLKMIQIDNELITILNWNKRQETNLTSYERVKKFRKKKQIETELKRKRNEKQTLEENRIEENRIEENILKKTHEENTISFLINIPDQVLKEFSEKYNCYSKQIISKGDDLYNYCLAKGKRYKNYKAFLNNAVKKDYGIRENLDPEQQARIQATKNKYESSEFSKELSNKFKIK